MKKSQLRKIIRESIKGLMTEQSQPGQFKLVIKTCSHQTDGSPNPQNFACKIYKLLLRAFFGFKH